MTGDAKPSEAHIPAVIRREASAQSERHTCMVALRLSPWRGVDGVALGRVGFFRPPASTGRVDAVAVRWRIRDVLVLQHGQKQQIFTVLG